MRTKEIVLTALFMSILMTGVISAQNDYELTSWTISSGGILTGETYTLFGLIGQPNTGILSGGAYTLVSGYQPGGDMSSQSPLYKVYLPITLK